MKTDQNAIAIRWYYLMILVNWGGRPSIGSVASKLFGSSAGAPPFVSYNGVYPGYLGAIYKPYKPKGGDLRLQGTMTADRLVSRTTCSASISSAL